LKGIEKHRWVVQHCHIGHVHRTHCWHQLMGGTTLRCFLSINPTTLVYQKIPICRTASTYGLLEIKLQHKNVEAYPSKNLLDTKPKRVSRFWNSGRLSWATDAKGDSKLASHLLGNLNREGFQMQGVRSKWCGSWVVYSELGEINAFCNKKSLMKLNKNQTKGKKTLC
jgi:hypothetical protein